MPTIRLTWENPNPITIVEDEIRVYRAAAPFDASSLPSILDTLSAGVLLYDDPTVVFGSYWYAVAYVKGSVVAIAFSDEIELGVSGPTFPIALTLVNPGAEAGDASGWSLSSGGNTLWTSTTDATGDYPGPKTGSRYFTGGTGTGVDLARMYQDVDVSAYAAQIDAGLVKALMSAWISGLSPNSDYINYYLRFLDATNAVISSVSVTDINFVNKTWISQQIGALMPSGTRKIRVEFWSTNISGTTHEGHFDDVTLTLYDDTYSLPGRYDTAISQGNRTSTITVSTTNITNFGTIANIVDGTNGNSYYWNDATGNGTAHIKFDFGSGASWIIDEFMWNQDIVTTHGVWRMEVSNDDVNWTQAGSDFTLSPGINQPGNPSNIAGRYVRLRHMSGSRSSAPYLREIRFRAKAP